MSLPPPTDNYVGEPQYPAPWTTKKPREGLRDSDEARIVSLAPDVCKSPTAPVPYPIVDFCGHDNNYTPSVRFTSQKSMVLRSNTTHVHGDEPGVGKGMKSGTVGDITEPIGHAPEVRAEGSNVIRHLDRFWMNNRNTVGEAVFVRDTKTYEAPVDDDPVPGSLLLADATGGAVILAQAQPKPATPAPRPPGKVIRPNIPQWNRPPPVPKPTGSAGAVLGRLGAFGRGAAKVGGAVVGAVADILLNPSSTAMPWHDSLPQDDFEKALFAKARELERQGIDQSEVLEWFRNERAANARRRQQQQAAPQPRIVPNPRPAVRVTPRQRRRRRPCLVGPYSVIAPICSGEAHHIVPDMVYRLGARPKKADDMRSTANRIPNAPTFNEGMAICLTSAEHGSGPTGLHGRLRNRLNTIGAASSVPGTAPMASILAESVNSIQQIPGLPASCKLLAATSTTTQVQNSTGFSAPGRTRESPLPSGRARDVLMRGSY